MANVKVTRTALSRDALTICAFLFVFGGQPHLAAERDKTHGTPRVVPGDKTEMRNGITYVQGERIPYTGVVTEIRTVDESKVRYSFDKGREHGRQRIWHPNGKLSIEYYAKEGRKHGPYRAWHYSGELEIEQQYLRGSASGPVYEWHENGNIRLVGLYKNGELDGVLTTFHKNGQVYSIAHLKDGKLDGLYMKWDKEGKVMSQKYYSAKLDKEVGKEVWLSEQPWNVQEQKKGLESP
jgi:antitoxin component YwqK of YwqJK toxin-antitoxin module